MSLLLFLVLLVAWGFVVGALARFALPGPDPMPWWATVVLGLGGSFLGGVVARILIGTTGGLFFAFLGSVVLLVCYRRFVQHRGITDRTLPR